MSVEDDLGRKVHCRVLGSKDGVTGIVTIGDGKIEADLFSYDGPIDINPAHAVYLQTENQSVASLHRNYGNQAGRKWGPTDDARRKMVYHQGVRSNVAVIGPDPWLGADEIKSTTFQIAHVDRVLQHESVIEKLLDSQFEDATLAERKLFEVSAGLLKVAVDYGINYSGDHFRPTKITPLLTINFDEPQTLDKYLIYVTSITWFFSGALGVYLLPSNIQISRQSTAEIIDALDNDRRVTYHTVVHRWPKLEINERDIWHGNSFVNAWDAPELEALKACLTQWVERDAEWRSANSLMMASRKLANVISPERLLNACKWLEEIPGAKPKRAIRKDHVDQISAIASVKAGELGYSDLVKRVAGAVRSIAAETRMEQYQRLLRGIQTRFGDDVLGEHIIDDLTYVNEFRGMAAHQSISFEDERKSILFDRALHAMEAFCYLLTLRDMPMTRDGELRLWNNPFIENYRTILRR